MLARLTNKAFADTTDAAIPHPRDVSPRLRELEDQIGAFKARLTELQRERVLSFQAWREGKPDQATRDAAAILAGRTVERHRPVHEIDQDIAAIEAAIEQLRQDTIPEAMKASAIIRDRVAPRHTALVKEMGHHMLALRQSFVDYLDFARDLNEKGIAWTALWPMHPTFLGEPDYRYSPVAQWLREAASHGFIDREEIPEGLRHG